MGSRILITGCQLGMLIGISDSKERQELAEKIENEQYIGGSNNNIKSDCKEVREFWLKIGD